MKKIIVDRYMPDNSFNHKYKVCFKDDKTGEEILFSDIDSIQMLFDIKDEDEEELKIMIKTERNIYKNLYEDLLDKFIKQV